MLRATAAALVLGVFAITNALAAPPVRIAIVPGGGSGMEQEVCDRVTDRLNQDQNLATNIRIGTVNPDWYATVSVIDKTDLVAQTARVNGTATIKTRDGHVIDTISVQSNKQDFNLSPGTAAPMNKALVESAVKEVLARLTDRTTDAIANAVPTEIETRDKIIQSNQLADQDKYGEALDILMTIQPDTPHFKGARLLVQEFQMEQDALDLMREAKEKAKQGRSAEAVAKLKAISKQSKRYKAAQQMISVLSPRYRTARRAAPTSNDQVKALTAQKKALDLQRKAIEAQEAALTRKAK